MLIAVALLAGTGTAQTVRYVDASCGNDLWSGTSPTCVAPDGPLASIGVAVAASTTGDEVRIAPGVYSGFLNRGISLSGVELALVATGPGVVIEGEGFVGVTVRFSGGAATRIEGITFRGCSSGVRVVSSDSPLIRNCRFENSVGAALRITESDPTIEDCVFVENTLDVAELTGAAISILDASPVIRDCLFELNQSNGGVSSSGGFTSGRGGAIGSVDSSPEFRNCVFRLNQAASGGGAVRAVGGSPLFHDCEFDRNTSSGNGGAVRALDTDLQISGGRFVGNESTQSFGGAIFVQGGTPSIDDCRLENNGGKSVIAFIISTPTISNSSFWQNPATAIYCSDASPVISHCTFTANAGDTAGALSNTFTSSPTVENCILWGNLPSEIVATGVGTTTVRWSDVDGGWTGAGESNLDVAPQFANVGTGDLRLTDGSACIDAGNSTLSGGSGGLDIDGLPRFHDDPCAPDVGVASGASPVVDMGAHEFPSVSASLCSSLRADVFEVSLSAGGAQNLDLEAGAPAAGQSFVLLGSISGTFPGVDVAAVHLPLNPDSFTLYTLSHPNQPPYVSSAGVLDVGGQASASIGLNPGSSTGLAGLALDHAFVALSPALEVEFASNAVPLLLGP